MAEVSIIVPVYNVEKYLSFCLDSLVNQTFKDIEIICVNDGSTDNSTEVLEHYAGFDKRIKIINKENGGLSSARNAGLDAASGKYIAFVDSDDFVSHFLVERAYNFVQKKNADFAAFGFDYVVGNFLKLYESGFSFPKSLVGKCVYETDLNENFYTKIHPTAWCKFYSAKLIQNNNLRFCEDIIFEDLPFAAEVYLSANRMVYTNLPLYYYRAERQGSILSRRDEKTVDFMTAIERVDDVFHKYGRFEKYKNALMQYNIQRSIHYFITVDGAYREKFFYSMKKYFSKFNFKEYDRRRFAKDKNLNLISLMVSCNYPAFCKAVKRHG